ncbi:MAG TPA: cysteine desulfurase [Bacteroidales bacterium]|nr:cysteine desulfurase [Bacteroidales bacterium]
MSFNVQDVRNDFPLLSRTIYDKPLVYFDNGATTQKPRRVIDCINSYHTYKNSSIHRGVHYLSELATQDFENARVIIQEYINARAPYEIIFTSGTTSAINGVAFSFGERYVSEGDEIIVSEMEHHANIVPWQLLCERKKAHLKVLSFKDDGVLDLPQLEKLISVKTRIIAVTHVSNALGTVNPVEEIIQVAHRHNVPVLVDGAQSVQHIPVDVVKMDCDFYVFSGHKIYGPTGTGILYGKEKWLEEMPPFMGGGEMVDVVTFEKTTFNTLPFKFEAGTPNYIGGIGLAEAIKYIQSLGLAEIAAWEQELLAYATRRMNELGYIRIYGNAPHKSAILSFLIDGVHPYDAGMVIDKMGIAVRTGTHCAQPVMQHFGIDGTIRASMAFYNTTDEIDTLVEAVRKVKTMFG